MTMNRILPAFCAVFALACTDGGGDDTDAAADTRATGQARYDDAETEPDGAAREAAHPEPQPASDPMWVEIRFEGTGDLSVGDPQCDLSGLGGGFEGLYEGEATLDEDGVYVASFSETEAVLTTPSGCELPSVDVDVITGVTVKGYLSTTQENCESYCSARARAYAEEECAGDSDEVSCRAEAETEYAASCDTTCSGSTTYRIVAESSLDAAALADLTGDSLAGAALGTLDVDLTFDRIEDTDEQTIDEAP